MRELSDEIHGYLEKAITKNEYNEEISLALDTLKMIAKLTGKQE